MSKTNISESFLITPACQETFLSLQAKFAWPLRERGVIAAGISILTAPFAVGRVSQPFHTVLCTLHGGAKFMTPVEEGVIEPGNVWIGPAGTTYRYEAEKAWHVFWFHLAEGPRWAALAEQAVSQQKMSSLEVLRAATEGFIAESVRREPDADVAARAYAEIIGVFLDRELGKAQSAAHRRTRYQLAGLWESVNAKPAAPWTVARLADLLSVSPVHLHRLTLRHHSLTPMAMVTNLRMGRAEAMLGSNNYTLDQIAAAVGYETPFAFSRAFKRHVGQSPKMYRTERQLQKP